MADQYHAPPEGQSAYTEAESDRLIAEQRKWEQAKNSPKCSGLCAYGFAMDIDRCPLHGRLD